MKSSEIAMIVLIASVSMMVAFFTANSLDFLKVDEQSVTVRTIEEIPDSISESDMPSATIFNKDAVNPTVKTVVGKDE